MEKRVSVLRPSQVNDDVLSAWINDRLQSDKVDAATVNRGLNAARSMLRWAAEHNPPLCGWTALAKRTNLHEVSRAPHPIIPSPEEWKTLVGTLASLDDGPGGMDAKGNARGMALLVLVAVQTGQRIDELRHTRVEDILTDGVRVSAYGQWSPKSWHERTIPLPPGVPALILEFVRWRDRARGANGRRLVLGDHWIGKRLDAAWRAAELPGEVPGMHDARRTFVTELIRAGHGLAVARDRAGHRDVATTERYIGKYRSDATLAVPDLGLAAALTRSPGATVIPFGKGSKKGGVPP